MLNRIRQRLAALFRTLTGQQLALEANLRNLQTALDNANKRLMRLERRIGDSRVGLRASQRRIERDIHAVVRILALDPSSLPFPHRIAARRFRLNSQNEEDGMIHALVGASEGVYRRFVELGCGSNGGNSGFVARELGWKGLMIDGDAGKLDIARQRFATSKVKCLHSWITRETVNQLISENGLDGEIGMLSIDIDGNDYWLWEAIDACAPRLVVIEYNSLFGSKQSVAVPYDERFDRHDHPRARDGKAIYFGASLEALTRLATRKGYRLVAVEPRGVNAFFLREGFRPEVLPSSPKDCFRILDKYVGHSLAKLVEEHGLPLVGIA